MSDTQYGGVMTAPIEPLMRIGDVCQVLDVCRATVYRLVARGELRPVAVGGAVRFEPREIRRFIETSMS